MKRMKRICAVVTAICMAVAICTVAYADNYKMKDSTEEGSVIKVGFPVQEGMSYIDEDGNYTGYLVDYLEQLSFFTGWEYEYITVDGSLNEQLAKFTEMLDNGSIDMLGTMNKNSYLEEIYLYPENSYGVSYTILAVKEGSQQWIPEDYSNWNGIRIGTYGGSEASSYSERNSKLSEFASINGFTYELVVYDTYDRMVEAIEKDEVDAVIQSELSMEEGLRGIAKFSPNEYYFALNKNEKDILAELNRAMKNVKNSYPNLENELYEKYFDFSDEFIISDHARDEIRKLGNVKILFFEGGAPYQYLSNGALKGYAVEYIDRFCKATGMKYTPVIAKSYDEGMKLIANNEVDLVACAGTSTQVILAKGIEMTKPYIDGNSVVVFAKNHTEERGEEAVQVRTNTESALNEVLEDENYVTRVDSVSLNFYLRKEKVYDNLFIDYSTMKPVSYAIAVTDNISEVIIPLLNLYESTVGEAMRSEMMFPYTSDEVEYTFGELILVYRPVIAVSAFVLILIVLISVLHRRNLNEKSKSDEIREQIRLMSEYDGLTGAYNGAYFRKLLAEICEKQENRTLVSFNIKNFKYINETYGIANADCLLSSIKLSLDDQLTDNEIFCREAADQFYIVLDDNIPEVVEARMSDMFEKFRYLGNMLLDDYPVTFYCGYVGLGSSPEPYNPIINMTYVMEALAAAKASNSNSKRIHRYDSELHNANQTRHYVETHMESALENKEFKVYLQPKKNLLTGNVDSAEALVRWFPADRDPIYPNEFIPLFEENGFCIDLDLYMMDRVCSKIREWIDIGLEPVSISVNQTRLLFSYDKYIDRMKEIVGKYNIPAEYITLEILEGLALEEIDHLNEVIDQLKEIGFKVSLDDFGSGYSSLNVLGDLNIDELKVDRGFLMGRKKTAFGDSRRDIVIEQIIYMAKKIGVSVVAEGVETSEDEELIRRWNFDYGQGYYYSRPVDTEKFCEQYLTKNEKK